MDLVLAGLILPNVQNHSLGRLAAATRASGFTVEVGDKFEEQEHKLLGGGGFEGSLKEVGDLEKTLGIHDLARFTP